MGGLKSAIPRTLGPPFLPYGLLVVEREKEGGRGVATAAKGVRKKKVKKNVPFVFLSFAYQLLILPKKNMNMKDPTLYM